MSAPIPREEPVDPRVARALALADRVSYRESRARELRERAAAERSCVRAESWVEMAEAFEAAAELDRATLRAVIRSEVCS